VVPFTDTPKKIDKDGFIASHGKRDEFAGAQTPQAFEFAPLLEAHRKAAATQASYTDDAEIWAAYTDRKIKAVPGDRENKKITYKEDIVVV
jgi:2-C-methyl-D-erythritol 4-phosphate cytidylyltransferase/2-C-methyl-D-erythritol 2,4-cyclodiphosphate synthase